MTNLSSEGRKRGLPNFKTIGKAIKAGKQKYEKLLDDYNKLKKQNNKNIDDYNELLDDYNELVEKSNDEIDEWNDLKDRLPTKAEHANLVRIISNLRFKANPK